TPAYLTPATNITELSAVTTLRTASRARAAPPIRRRLPAAARAHGVAHSTSAASGNRIACAVIASISRRGALRRTTETAQASAASALADAAVTAPAPAVVSTQTTRRALPTVERTALTATEPSSGTSARARRLVTAQVSAEPSAASAPRVVSGIRRAGSAPGP